MRRDRSGRTVAVALVAGCCGGTPAHAQSVADFYRGKTVQVVMPSNVGGSVALYGRLVADHLGRHIPGNPTVILMMMPGAGGVSRWSSSPMSRPRTARRSREILRPTLLVPMMRKVRSIRRSCNGSARSPLGPAWSRSGTPRVPPRSRAPRGRAQHGIERRRRRQLPDPDARQHRARHKIQSGDRLQGRRRHQPRDRARRGRRPLQLLDRLDHGEAGLDPRQEAQIPVPHRTAGARYAGVAGFRRFASGEERQMVRILEAPDDVGVGFLASGIPVRSCCGAAQGVLGHRARQQVPGGGGNGSARRSRRCRRTSFTGWSRRSTRRRGRWWSDSRR